ncbi:type II toxin-antitoxin system RelE/ParE family toxin [Microcystis aeruginosa]|uniref:type II toxin-antitoxin system RelE/ParE family toxin n=1 Tax=Microcystis aeruginosa TaxID=1126 RepID=UPI00287FBBE5|nr:type II toxin-antitoxin system RelE/ParE family toxin [Microcystis aeruginosa]WNF12882.1 type II toxin-antitoxin system RelE/ParE family toxin [Microcystis aeruginosa NRERC-214]
MKVFCTETAVNHLSSIYNYISQNSPQYAQRLVERLTRRSEQIANFPFSGRLVPEFETEQIREVIEVSYRIIYYIKPEQIDVIAVLHAARNIENPQD